MSAPAYAELQVTSNFSFLRGASAAEELFAAAAANSSSAEDAPRRKEKCDVTCNSA